MEEMAMNAADSAFWRGKSMFTLNLCLAGSIGIACLVI
jgi:hypothetical protein